MGSSINATLKKTQHACQFLVSFFGGDKGKQKLSAFLSI